MLKRKREPSRPIVIDLTSDDEEIAVATPTRRDINKEREESEIDEEDTDRFRAGGTAISNGLTTPLSLEKHSEVDRLAEGSDVAEDEIEIDRPKRIEIHAEKMLVPDCRGGSAYPRSVYQGYQPPLPEVCEREAIEGLLAAHEKAHMDDEEPDYIYFALDQFSIYRAKDAAGHSQELVSLDRLSKNRFPEFCFDGILSCEGHKSYVCNVAFRTLTIDGYGDLDTESADMSKQLCIQSLYAKKNNAWLRLGRPASEYARFYQPFLWLARFGKHFVDYLLCTEQVTIAHFREAFYRWLQRNYKQDVTFYTWLAEANLQDFRTTVASHVEFLWKECCGVSSPSDEINICKHELWGEVHPNELSAIPQQRNLAHRTVVTPFAFDCFKTMYFADQFVPTPITDIDVREKVQDLKAKLGLTPLYEPSAARLTPMSESQATMSVPLRDTTANPLPDITATKVSAPLPVAITAFPIEVAVGDVVMLPPEKEGRWKSAADCWYAYVQRIRVVQDTTRLDVIWLYSASDTTIGTAYYPFPNELFFSDNCGCDTHLDKESWDLLEVIQKVDVSWFTHDPYKETGLFVRQKFRTVPEMGHYDFVTLHESDFRCNHQPDHQGKEEESYEIGDVVLARDPRESLCEVAQVVGGRGRHLRLRRLRKKCDLYPSSARANELVLTSEIFEASLSQEEINEDEEYHVVRKCHVRSFAREDIDSGNILAPYDRDGSGDYFVVEAESADDADADADVEKFPAINEAWDPRKPPANRQLTGMGIFCGGGTFDRGLEEGGAVRFRYAVDWAEHALHSYRANLKDPNEVHFFLGSVNDYLANALSGQISDAVAMPGSIQVLSAGSPCQGFSRLQQSTASEESKQNASMVASVVAFVDLYCPEHLILENVVAMTESRDERKEHNVFSQIIAALVGLGYQVQQFLLDAWSHGSPQQRSRVFIVATAPGRDREIVPPPQPQCSHAHPLDMKMRSLGKSSNGLPFGSRRVDPDVAFYHTSPQEAVADLPIIYDSQPQLCPAFPEHRTATDESQHTRARMRAVPTRPRGMNLVRAREQGLLSGEPLAFYERCGPLRKAKGSKMYGRILPHRLFPTMLTKLAIGDGMNGQGVHWDQHRAITVMEAKRAQGYLDHEVLVGSAGQQMKIVGNSVDRRAALVIGLSLRESWLRSCTFSPGTPRDEECSVQSTDVDMERQDEDEDESRIDSFDIDNRTVKMSLTLSRADIDEINQETATSGRTFKAIIRKLQEMQEHRTARQSLQGQTDGAARL